MTFRQRFEDAQGRVASLNRGEMGVQTLEGPGSDKRLRQIQKRFEKVSLRANGRAVDKARLGLGLWLVAWATCVGIAAAIVLAQFRPERSLTKNLQHIASVPNCAAARLVGAAPANVGEPGYWSGHDRDKDGVACEPIPE